MNKYNSKIIEIIEHGSGYWNTLVIGVFLTNEAGEEVQIGKYQRNYPEGYQTFLPFEQDGKEYALYSTNYTATRVMRLPSCEDLCGEENDPYGFCPVEYYVPEEGKGKIGFVAGCVWGDDSSFKIQFLDLSRIEEGVFVNDARFGYVVIPDDFSLKSAINMDDFDPEDGRPIIAIASERRFNLDKGEYEAN